MNKIDNFQLDLLEKERSLRQKLKLKKENCIGYKTKFKEINKSKTIGENS